MKHYGQRIEVKPQIATFSTKLQRIHTLRNLPDRVLHQKYHKILPHAKAVSISRLLKKWKNSNQMRQQQNPTLILKMSLLTSTAWLSQLELLQLHTWTQYWDTMASILLGFYGLDPIGILWPRSLWQGMPSVIESIKEFKIKQYTNGIEWCKAITHDGTSPVFHDISISLIEDGATPNIMSVRAYSVMPPRTGWHCNLYGTRSSQLQSYASSSCNRS